ncbi:uncharacterized protein K444DRAFT_281749 [Hyaloscypha bicolor E]|uniref:Uncharacterized protein n=1 Tax=Hyaloscypha bicolor E TaxID=1095630 RepID=A0A2J6SG23_9HELO|nr:uncharacterized protein K444DRAFT_281749 [Hyaloscypha bicolor E]PMD49699.1 hypothetical protein K444DRAFT_281749 [Hyaloscypha bicolor E]
MPPLQNNNPPRQDTMAQSNRSKNAESMAQSSGVPPRLRSEESWVEIASQPSSSSLSSIGDEIVITGLRVQQDSNVRRRRRVQAGAPQTSLHPRQNTSSQEEYEESESEDDQVMTSSNEHVIPIPTTRLSTVSRTEYDAGSDSDDDDENATALGKRTDAGEPAFTPQPNAFSHPPPSHRSSLPSSYFPPHAGSSTRPPYPSRNVSRQRSSYNPQADHDAALRASLTTLLSIGAAAARGLPKRGQQPTTMGNEPMGLRFVPESELMAPTTPTANTSRHMSPSTRARSSPSISSQEAVEKGKRKAAASKPGEKTRALKKKRMQAVEEEALISPTLLTWVVSAGVVVLVSVVGFGAGYVIGREVGRQEVLGGLNGSTIIDGGSCGREVARSTGSLRRFKWGMGGAAKAIVA